MESLIDNIPVGSGAEYTLGFTKAGEYAGHATALFRPDKDTVIFFDPNFGEYQMPPQELGLFLSTFVAHYYADLQLPEQSISLTIPGDGKGDILAVQSEKVRKPLTETQLHKLYSKEVQTEIAQTKQQSDDNTIPWVKNDQGKWVAATAVTKEMNQTAHSAQLVESQQAAFQPFQVPEPELRAVPSSANSNSQPTAEDVQINNSVQLAESQQAASQPFQVPEPELRVVSSSANSNSQSAAEDVQINNSAQLAEPQQATPQPFQQVPEPELRVVSSSANLNSQPTAEDVQLTEKTKESATLTSAPSTAGKPVTVASGIAASALRSMFKTFNAHRSSETTFSTAPTAKKLSSSRFARTITAIKNTFLKPLNNWFIKLRS